MSEVKIKICFIIPSLRAGGAERVMSFVAENIDKERFESHLLVIESEEGKSYDIADIPVTFLNKSRVRDGVPKIIGFIRKNNIEIVISAIAHLNTIMAFISVIFPKVKFVGRETIVKSALRKVKNLPTNPSFKSLWLTKIQAINLDAIICQSEDMRDDLKNNFNFPSEKLVVLNNPITKSFHLKENRKRNTIKQFITIGRLVEQKGHIRILMALSQYDSPYHYTIIGSGDKKETIFEFIKENKLEKKITYVPFTKDVQSYLEKSDLYLQGSFVEGFPNALLESCTVGTPVLAFDALGGINEIIIEGVNGYIADDENDFIKKLKICVEKNWSPSDINDSVTSRYAEEIILKKYEDFFFHLHSSKK